MTHNKKPHNAKNESIWISALIGAGIALAVSIGLTLLAPIVLINTQSPNALSTAAAIAANTIGAGAGAFVSAIRCRQMPLQCGMLTAGLMLLPLLLISLFIPKPFDFLGMLISVAAVAAAAFLGAFTVHKTASSKKRNMKKALKRR